MKKLLLIVACCVPFLVAATSEDRAAALEALRLSFVELKASFSALNDSFTALDARVVEFAAIEAEIGDQGGISDAELAALESRVSQIEIDAALPDPVVGGLLARVTEIETDLAANDVSAKIDLLQARVAAIENALVSGETAIHCETPDKLGYIYAADCGATSGDLTDDTAAIQLAMYNAAKSGGSTVILPRGDMRWSDHDGDGKGLIMPGIEVRCTRAKACTMRWTQPYVEGDGAVGLYWNSVQRLPDGRLAPNPGSIHAGLYGVTMRAEVGTTNAPSRAWVLYGGQGMDQFTRVEANHFGGCGATCFEVEDGCINCRFGKNRFDNTRGSILKVDFKGDYFRSFLAEDFTIDISNSTVHTIFEFSGRNNIGVARIATARIEGNAASFPDGMCLVRFTKTGGSGFMQVTLDNIAQQSGFQQGQTVFCADGLPGGFMAIVKSSAIEHQHILGGTGWRQGLLDLWAVPDKHGIHNGKFWVIDPRLSDADNAAMNSVFL